MLQSNCELTKLLRTRDPPPDPPAVDPYVTVVWLMSSHTLQKFLPVRRCA